MASSDDSQHEVDTRSLDNIAHEAQSDPRAITSASSQDEAQSDPRATVSASSQDSQHEEETLTLDNTHMEGKQGTMERESGS